MNSCTNAIHTLVHAVSKTRLTSDEPRSPFSSTRSPMTLDAAAIAYLGLCQSGRPRPSDCSASSVFEALLAVSKLIRQRRGMKGCS